MGLNALNRFDGNEPKKKEKKKKENEKEERLP